MVFFLKKEKVSVIFVGLGNPGDEYEQTKHNVGFRVVDAFADEHLAGRIFKKQVGALVLKGTYRKQDYLLVKPQNYMNQSGQIIKWLVRRYPAEDIIVIYDDMDLPPGRLRLAQSGGSAGHKGMESIIDVFKKDEIKRIRVGIGGRGDMEGGDYVLTPFTGDDASFTENAVATAVKAMEEIMVTGFDRAMNLFNRRDLNEVLDSREQQETES